MLKPQETNNGKDGGLLKGKPHYDNNGKALGGIKAVVTDTKQIVELEGGEVIINKEASKKHWKELSKINQSAGDGVPILPPDEAVADADEYKVGGRTIEFNPNKLPNRWVFEYAKHIKEKYPKVWALGGNQYGNEAFKNLERAIKRGYWTQNEDWFYIKWQAFNARHSRDFLIAGVIANLKWLNKVDKGWDYMKALIEKEVEKHYGKNKEGWKHKMKTGGELAKGIKSEQEHISTAKKPYKHKKTERNKQRKSTKVKFYDGGRVPSTDPSTWLAVYKVGDKVKIRSNYSILSDVDTTRVYTIIQMSTAKSVNSRKENPTGAIYDLDNGQAWEGKDLELATSQLAGNSKSNPINDTLYFKKGQLPTDILKVGDVFIHATDKEQPPFRVIQIGGNIKFGWEKDGVYDDVAYTNSEIVEFVNNAKWIKFQSNIHKQYSVTLGDVFKIKKTNTSLGIITKINRGTKEVTVTWEINNQIESLSYSISQIEDAVKNGRWILIGRAKSETENNERQAKPTPIKADKPATQEKINFNESINKFITANFVNKIDYNSKEIVKNTIKEFAESLANVDMVSSMSIESLLKLN